MIEPTLAIASFLLLTDNEAAARGVAEILSRAGEVRVSRIWDRDPPPMRHARLFVDIDLASQEAVERYRRLVRRGDLQAATKLFLVDTEDYRGAKQAVALGADRVVERPLVPQAILELLRTEMASDFKARIDGLHSTRLAQGLRAAHEVLEKIFDGISSFEFVKPQALGEAAGIVAGSLHEEGLSAWLEAVASHHSGSYRHSLLVAGTATCFAQFIGANRADQTRVARAALAHDVGKALIPLAILDKPGKLTPDEMAEVRRHPDLGFQLLSERGGFLPDTLSVVRNHHEMCDGSGYPRGLSGAQIDDLTRMVTLADIFSALIEERVYKPAYSHSEALAIMEEMGPKLDGALLGVFGRMIRSQATSEASDRSRAVR